MVLNGPFLLQMKPIEGAESEGAFGFFKGVGKGLVGYLKFLLLAQELLTEPCIEQSQNPW